MSSSRRPLDLVVVLAAVALTIPLAASAAPVRGETGEEEAQRKAGEKLIQNNIGYETKFVENVCGSGRRGYLVHVQMKTGELVVGQDGKAKPVAETLTTYAVTERNFLGFQKVFECNQ